MADKLAIEETNRLRLSLGMTPLSAPGDAASSLNFKKSDDPMSIDDDDDDDTLEARHAAASSNWQKLHEEQVAKKQREERRANLKKVRESSQRFAKLEGRGLGDAEGDDVDTMTWLLGQGKRQKKIEKLRAKQLARDLAERERLAQVEYTAKDLAGAKVGHEYGDFEDGGEQVLTLKDTNVDASSDEDELENLQLREAESRKDRLKLKQKRPDYDPTGADGTQGVLSKYDEEIQGKKKNQFTLDATGGPLGVQSLTSVEESAPGRMKVSLDFLDEHKPPESDYQDISKVKIKKPKKKKDKSKLRKPTGDDDIIPAPNGDAMDVDDSKPKSTSTSKRRASDDLDDDDDLQARLLAQRQKALKKRKKMTPEEIARQVREEAAEEANAIDVGPSAEDSGLVFDETSRFIDTLEYRDPEPAPPRHTRPTSSGDPTNAASPTSDIPDDTPNYIPIPASHPKASAEPSRPGSSSHEPASSADIGEEPDLNIGVGSTLKLLTERGILKTAAGGDLNAQHREHQRFIAEKHRREAAADARARADRDRDRASGRFSGWTAKEREAEQARQNQERDHRESRAAAEIFDREYRPNVELQYVDEYGRRMNQKEAFKHLSHQFHGKGSGKGKTEKKLKKIEDEKMRAAKSILDTGREDEGLGRALGQQARKKGQAGVRLQ